MDNPDRTKPQPIMNDLDDEYIQELEASLEEAVAEVKQPNKRTTQYNSRQTSQKLN